LGREPEHLAHRLRRGSPAGPAHGAGRSLPAISEGHAEPRSARLPPRTRGARGEREGGGAGVIEVESLTVRFAGVTPIDDVSLTFASGTCGLIGPNGAGKTTFFNVLSGFVRPARGRIH